MSVDPASFPTLATYLVSLPNGIDSYPQCLAKASLLRAVVDELGGPRKLDGIPPPLARELAKPSPPNAWIREVTYVAAHFALLDALGLSEPEMLEATYRANRKLTESRMYRALAQLASPNLLLRGAEISWRLIHRGVSLRMHPGSQKMEIFVRHPSGLWTAVAHQSAALGFRAVVEASNGDNADAQVVESRLDGARFEVTWD